LWTDGYLDAPMMPRAVRTTRCPSCAQAFSIEDAGDLGEHWNYGSFGSNFTETLPQGYEDAPAVQDADPHALSELISQTEDRDRLRYLRTLTWHIYNHAYRDSETNGQALKPIDFDENLEHLIGLLEDDHGQDQILKAEALRELGMHAEAMATLKNIDTELAWVADQLRFLAQAGVSAVGVMLRPGEHALDARA